ncbi:hypothetical protein [Sphingomonas sp. 3-13AW]|uniref:hypothetical protein n=1 Tax=Sphingomonas sp. 3-13AW TaxID=3050450 RepID=UPI003BB58D37
MAKARTLKAYLMGIPDDAEIVLTELPEHTDHVDGDFVAMDRVIAQLDDIEEKAGS